MNVLRNVSSTSAVKGDGLTASVYCLLGIMETMYPVGREKKERIRKKLLPKSGKIDGINRSICRLTTCLRHNKT